MKRIIVAELEYIRKRIYWAWGFATVPLFILLAIVDPLTGGKVPFDESPFIMIICFYSVFPAILFIMENENNKQRMEKRTKLLMMLPITRLQAALARQMVNVLAMAGIIIGWSLMFSFTGVNLLEKDIPILLLMNALFWGIICGASLVEQIKQERYAIRMTYTVASTLLFTILFSTTSIGKNLLRLFEGLPLDIDLVITYLDRASAWITSMEGAVTATVVAIMIPFVAVFQFTRRRSYLGK